MTKTAKLAFDGGTPVRQHLLPYAQHTVDQGDIESVIKALKSALLTQGPMVQAFEEAICAYTGAKYATAFSSGTSALHAAAQVAGVRSGDKAVTTPMTFAASANCIHYQGGSVRFVDIHEDTLNIDETLVEKAIDNHTKAIVAVDYAGHPCEYEALKEISRRRRLTLISDAAHSLGATYHGKKVGTLADLTTFSFHPAKLITSGEGGMVLTNDEAADHELKVFRHHGIEKEMDRMPRAEGGWYYEMRELGNNYRLSDIQCALGISQLKKIDRSLKRRREIAATYNKFFKGHHDAQPLGVRPPVESAWHIYPIRVNLEAIETTRKTIFDAYRAENIGVQIHYIPVYHHPYYRKANPASEADFPITEKAYAGLITLPLFPAMIDQDVQDVLNATEKIFSHFTRG
jgi:perosamine synthetase